MSLINDALKKAGESSAPPPPLPGSDSGKISLRAPQQSRGLPLPLIIFPLILAVILGLAGYFLFHGLNRKAAGGWRGSVHKAVARERSAGKNSSELDPSRSEVAADPSKTAAPGARTKASAQTAALPVTNAPGALAPVAPGAFPQLKVQGIFYRAKNPGAMINSKTVFVGDRVSEARIVAIAQDSVTVEFGGQKKVLTLY